MLNLHPKTSPLFTIEQVAEQLAVSTRTVRRWIKGGELVAHRLGHCWRVSRADLAAFLNRKRGG